MGTKGPAAFRLLLLGIALAAALFSSAVTAKATPSKDTKIYRLLILDSQKGFPYDEMRAALLNALASCGYAVGRNLDATVRFCGNDVREGERILHEEAGKPYDVIFVGGTAATLAARHVLYGTSARVVFGAPTDPVGIGVIRDFGRPGANFTGVCYPVPVKARLRFIRRLMPKARTFGLIYADMPQSHSYNKWLDDLLKNSPEFRDIRIIYRSIPLVTGEEGDRAMAVRARKIIRELDPRVDAYIKPCDQMGSRRHFSEVVSRTSKRPLIGLVRDDVMGRWGAAAAIYPSHESIGRQAARMVTELFQGRRVSDIPPEWPKKYGVAIDLRKARQFGIDVPVELLQAAGENIVR
ncbi:MAG TPA: ABC transporter substrate binding protein [Desulfuromonadaceae bacterium]